MAQRRRWAADEGVRELSERDRRHARRKERNHHHHHYCGGDERASEPSRFDLMAMAGARARAGAGAPLPPKFKSEMTIFRPAAPTFKVIKQHPGTTCGIHSTADAPGGWGWRAMEQQQQGSTTMELAAARNGGMHRDEASGVGMRCTAVLLYWSAVLRAP